MIKDRSDQGKIAEKVMGEAIKEAIEEQLKKGVPAVFMRDGVMCYQMPDGSIVEAK